VDVVTPHDSAFGLFGQPSGDIAPGARVDRGLASSGRVGSALLGVDDLAFSELADPAAGGAARAALGRSDVPVVGASGVARIDFWGWGFLARAAAV